MLKFLKRTALWIVAVPLLMTLLGAAANQAVLVANHDRFPVMVNDYKVTELAMEMEGVATSDSPKAQDAHLALEALKYGFLDETHVIMSPETHLNFLADWIDVGGVYSPGDLLYFGGLDALQYAPFLWAAFAIGKLNKKEE